MGKERVMARGAAVAVGGGGHGSRRAWRASRGLPRLLWASRVKEKGMGAGRGVGQLGQRPRLSPSVACAAERGVSEGGVRARVGVMARRSEAAVRRQQAQRGSSAASCGRYSEGRHSSALPCSALRPGSREAGGGRKEGERERVEREREVRELTLNFLKIFNGSSKKFEYKSCSKFKILQLSFQAHFHLKLHLKVKNSN